jgi:hypothetical protein
LRADEALRVAYGVAVITPHDDYPLHQTSKPIAIPADGDANRYDRFFFNGYTADGSLYFGAAMGVYPVRETIDASFSVVLDRTKQVNVHASGRCPIDRSQTGVGPITVHIVEPMRLLRLVVEAPEQGLRADLTFTASTAPVEEDPFLWRNGPKVVFDYTRLTQWGTWTGWIEVDGERIEVSPTEVMGSRDRSWGVRPVGEQVPAPVGSGFRQFYWLWAPVTFPGLCTHFDVNEFSTGSRWHESGFLIPKDGQPAERTAIDYRITWRPGSRYVASFEVDFISDDGPTTTVRLTPIFDFMMRGIGYGHPTRGHGKWHSDLSVDGDRWSLPLDEPLMPGNIHVQTLAHATLLVDGVETAHGTGILESLVVGPHAPSGFKELLDGAS